MAPLFEVQLDLRVPDMVFIPSLEFGAADGFCDLVESLINDVYRISSLMPRLAQHCPFPHYQVLTLCCSPRPNACRVTLAHKTSGLSFRLKTCLQVFHCGAIIQFASNAIKAVSGICWKMRQQKADHSISINELSFESIKF